MKLLSLKQRRLVSAHTFLPSLTGRSFALKRFSNLALVALTLAGVLSGCVSTPLGSDAVNEPTVAKTEQKSGWGTKLKSGLGIVGAAVGLGVGLSSDDPNAVAAASGLIGASAAMLTSDTESSSFSSQGYDSTDTNEAASELPAKHSLAASAYSTKRASRNSAASSQNRQSDRATARIKEFEDYYYRANRQIAECRARAGSDSPECEQLRQASLAAAQQRYEEIRKIARRYKMPSYEELARQRGEEPYPATATSGGYQTAAVGSADDSASHGSEQGRTSNPYRPPVQETPTLSADNLRFEESYELYWDYQGEHPAQLYRYYIDFSHGYDRGVNCYVHYGANVARDLKWTPLFRTA